MSLGWREKVERASMLVQKWMVLSEGLLGDVMFSVDME